MSNFEMVNFLDFVGFSPTVSCLEQGQKKRFSAGLACRQERENLALPKIYLPCFLPSSSTHTHVVTSLALLSLLYPLATKSSLQSSKAVSRRENLGVAAVLLLHCETIPFCIWFSSLKKKVERELQERVGHSLSLSCTKGNLFLLFKQKILQKDLSGHIHFLYLT